MPSRPISPLRAFRRRRIAAASALVSLAGCCATLSSLRRHQHLVRRFFALRLVCFLTLANLFFSVLGVAGPLAEAGGPCEAQVAGLLYFELASVSWTTCLSAPPPPRTS